MNNLDIFAYLCLNINKQQIKHHNIEDKQYENSSFLFSK